MNKKQRKAKRDAQKLVGIFDDLIDNSAKVKILPDVPKPREIIRQLVMFWRREKCDRCKKTYEASHYGALPMLQLELQKPIVHFGRMYGWRYVSTIFRHVTDVSAYDHLPHKIEYIDVKLRVCPNCLYRPKVIYLSKAS